VDPNLVNHKITAKTITIFFYFLEAARSLLWTGGLWKFNNGELLNTKLGLRFI
jgi:hypothetical protein